jgi:hypothetical protein
MTDVIQERLFKVQERYDALEARLQEMPAFRRYLEREFLQKGQVPEAALTHNADFQEWLAIAAATTNVTGQG